MMVDGENDENGIRQGGDLLEIMWLIHLNKILDTSCNNLPYPLHIKGDECGASCKQVEMF